MQNDILIFTFPNALSSANFEYVKDRLTDTLPEFRVVIVDQCNSVTQVKVDSDAE